MVPPLVRWLLVRWAVRRVRVVDGPLHAIIGAWPRWLGDRAEILTHHLAVASERERQASGPEWRCGGETKM